MTFKEYCQYDGLGLAELIRTKQVSSHEVLEAAIARAESLNPKINAIVSPEYERSRNYNFVADGAFAGVPFLIKDLSAAQAGVINSFGSKFCADFTLEHDSGLVQRFKKAGLVIFGRTNSCEFGLKYMTEPELWGSTNNPWDLTRTPGGSSGGAAAAVASRILPIAHASDGGGSIRVPAASCGIFGLKPTRGRISTMPDTGEGWAGLSINFAVSVSVRDSAAMLDAMSGYVPGDPYCAPPAPRSYLQAMEKAPKKLRIAVNSDPMLEDIKVHEQAHRAVEHVAKLCQDLGHDVEFVDLYFDKEKLGRHILTIISSNLHASINGLAYFQNKKVARDELEDITYQLYELGGKWKATDYVKAIGEMQLESRRIACEFEKFDVLLTPTLAQPPVKTGALKEHEKTIQDCFALQTSYTPFTSVFNMTGQPAMSVPLYWTKDGLPLGVQFAASFGDELMLLQLARQLEQSNPWKEKIPIL